MPIEELFYQGKNPRTKGHRTTTTTTTAPTHIEDYESDSDYTDDIWDDYFDDVPAESEPVTNKSVTATAVVPVEKGDYVKDLPRGIYCDLVTTLDKRCFELSLLEIWDFDGEIIGGLTQQEILDAVNTLDMRFVKIDAAKYSFNLSISLFQSLVFLKKELQ